MAKRSSRTSRTSDGRRSGRASAVLAAACALILLASCFACAGASLAGTAAEGLRISEIMTNAVSPFGPDGAAAPDWFEIENASSAAVELSGYAVICVDNPSKAFVFPGGSLQPGERVVVYADDATRTLQDGAYHAPFRLAASGEEIALLDRQGERFDEVAVPALPDNHVYCRDAAGEWQVSAAATPGEANRIESARAASVAVARGGALEITEVMAGNATYHPDEDGAFQDYVEIHNASDVPVNLAGWALSDDLEAPAQWRFPEWTLPVDGYLVVHCSGESRTDDPAHPHADFKLSREGEDVCLTQPDGTLSAHVRTPALNADQAYSLRDGVWTGSFAPSPGQPNTPSGADIAAAAILERNPTGVRITEIMASASATCDWIELYNGSDRAVDLSSYGLSDNAGRPRKWQFPANTVLQPGEYLGVMASGLDAALNANYRLSAAGGYSLTLSDENGAILDRVPVPEQYEDVSYGRAGDGTSLRYFSAPTPGTANGGETWQGRAPMASCSVPGGFRAAGDVFTVTLDAPDDCRVYYTLDCTDPDESSARYDGPITVSDTTILRTRVYRDGCMPSFMDARSYLYDVQNGDGAVYVVSLVSDPYNLTSDEAGILVEGTNDRPNYMMDWEREAHVEIFDASGDLRVSQPCGVKQQGQTCRAEPQQSLKLVARGRYGENLFHGSIFSKRDSTECKALLLRTSNDDASKVRMRDSILSGLGDTTSLIYQETEVCVVYLNGVYWGHYNLREAINPHSICQFEGWTGDEDAIDLVRGNSEVLQGSNDTFEQLLDWMRRGDANTDAAYQALDSVIDIQNYIEYMTLQIYSGNTDPSNIKRYRNARADGKWRWVLFDMDWGFNQDTNSVRRWLTPGGVGNGGRTDNSFFIACMKNATFRDRFLTHLGQQMATNLTAGNILARFEARYNVLARILPDHFARWNTSESTYNKELSRLIAFAQSRPMRMLQFLKHAEALGLSQSQMETYFGEVMAQLGVTYAQIPKV